MHRLSKFLAIAVTITSLIISLNACQKRPQNETITVAIAASLSDVMGEIKTEFLQDFPQVDIQFNIAASGTLQRQIEQQAPIDVFASAALEPIEELTDKGLIDRKKITVFARNQLVLVQPTTSDLGLENITDLGNPQVKKIAMGNPKTVPAGQYAETALRRSPTLYQQLQDQRKFVYGENVRQVLTYILNGDVDAGLVYGTDVLGQKDIKVVQRLPEDLTGEILYGIAPIKSTQSPEIADELIAFILSEKGRIILANYGFLAPRD